MPAAQYPFIDIAVHSTVRDLLSQGAALALFSADMASVLWANGAGAAFFGTPLIYEFLENGPNRQDLTFRQLVASAGQISRVGESRALLMRVPKGFHSATVQARVEMIEVRPGEQAILFSLPATGAQASPAELSRRLLSGFDDPDIHMAVLDGEGGVIAASQGFARLDITQQTTRGFVTMVGHERNRLLKRPIQTRLGYLPAALGKLSETPALNLLFVVETTVDAALPADGDDPRQQETDSAEVVAGTSNEGEVDLPAEELPAEIEIAAPTADAFSTGEELTPEAPTDSVETDTQISSDDDSDAPLNTPTDAAPDEAEEIVESQSDTSPARVVSAAEPAEVSTSNGPKSDFVFDAGGRATRFVWKIDAEGRFSEVSDEFAAAVGPRSAAINGVSFAELAVRLELDPQGKIRELLGKRDTWSGKTILWPVEGTNLRVPVDLAALPTYTRTREFDGFRGFGIVRIADAVEDPEAAGLSIAAPQQPQLAATVDEPIEDRTETAPSAEPSGPFVDVLSASVIAANDDNSDGAATEVELASEAPAETPDEVAEPQEQPRPVPQDEPPAITIAETPNRRQSDKVIRIEERRPRGATDGLSAGEHAAFLEIARQLDPQNLRGEASDEVRAADATDIEPVDEMSHKTAKAANPDQGSDEPDDHSDHDEIHSDDTAVDPVASPVEVNEQDGEEPVADASNDDTAAAEASHATEDEAPADAEIHSFTEYASTINRREIGFSAEIVDVMPVALLVHVGDRLIHANPEFLKLSGYDSLDELAGAGGLDALLQRQDLDDASDQASRMVVVRADDELVPVSARLQSIRWAGSSALMLSLVQTEGKAPVETRPEPVREEVAMPEAASGEAAARDLAQLKVEVSELRSILETATDGVVILSADGEIRSMNGSASALFNYEDAEVRGKPFVMLFAHESQKGILDYLAGLSGHGVASVLNDGREVIGREASGGFLPLFMTIGKLTSSNGYCAVIRDITQWKRTEDELRNAKRAAETANSHKSDFLARVSHEIRTPLNAIIGFADMMANEHFGPIGHSRYTEYATDIVRSGRHVLDIVNDLLDISKIEAGEMDLDFTAVGLNETVSQAVAIVQPQANSQRVIIRTSLSQTVPSVVADLRSIKQIVLNILANAIRFTPSGGQIIVSSAYEPNGAVVLRVRDTGIGMSRAELEQAMKPFRQVATGMQARGEGTGLGLPLTKAMVDANRANFAISSAPNEGTLVEITFPSPRVLAD